MLKLLDKEKILQISRETKGSEAYVKRFDGYQHLVVMPFGILKHFDSLRELEIGMKAEAHKLGHLGMNNLVRRSTLAEANIRRPQEFFAGVYAYPLQRRYKKRHQNQVFSIRRAYFWKILPKVLFYGASGRIFMLFGVLPDSNSSEYLVDGLQVLAFFHASSLIEGYNDTLTWNGHSVVKSSF